VGQTKITNKIIETNKGIEMIEGAKNTFLLAFPLL
jgi:hypothetical protein